MLQLKASTILIIIGSHLATAPRVQKEARALRDAGAKVIVCGTWWSDSLAEEDTHLASVLDIDFRPVVDVRQGRSLRIRILQRLARELFCRFNWASPRSFGLGAPELLQAALRIKADISIVHSEAGLWVAKKLLAKGRKVGVDFEDWFSRDQLPSDRNASVRNASREDKGTPEHACCSFCTASAARAVS
jgi:hypothetical protein